MKAAIDAVPYASSVKIGLQFKRRFWEEDEAIYGGISYTDLPIRQISYPSTGFNRSWPRRAARRLCLRRCERLRIHLDGAGGAGRARGRIRRPHSSAIPRRVRKRHRRGLASRALHAGLRRKLDRRRCGRSITTICARSTAGSCWPASTLPTFRPGRRARYCPRSMRSPGCMNVSSGIDAMLLNRFKQTKSSSALSRGRLTAAAGARRRPDAACRAAHADENPCAAVAEHGLQIHGNDRRGTVRERLSGLPHAGRQEARSAPATIRRWPNDGNLESGGYPVYVVVSGQRAMPPIGAMMSDDQVAAVVNYVRTHFGNQYPGRCHAPRTSSPSGPGK